MLNYKRSEKQLKLWEQLSKIEN